MLLCLEEQNLEDVSPENSTPIIICFINTPNHQP